MLKGQSKVWEPTESRIQSSQMNLFQSFVAEKTGLTFKDYWDLHAWSIEETGQFWRLLADYTSIIWTENPGQTYQAPLAGHLLGARWFEGGRLNFAQNLLDSMADDAKVVSVVEGRAPLELDRQELRDRVARCARYLVGEGVGKGDRVAGVLANTEASMVAMLATAAVGAVWSSCSPDFGEQGIYDRFGQIEAKVLFATTGYEYGGKRISCRETIQALVPKLTSLKSLCFVDHLGETKGLDLADIYVKDYHDFAKGDVPPLEFVSLAFEAPLYIMFSSGTTGIPKCIIHTVGGTLLQHKKELALHSDLGPGSTLLYFTTCGWMMWNWMASAISVGASLVLFDGSPAYPDVSQLWRQLERYGVDTFGTSPKFLSATEKAGFCPSKELNLSKLRCILSTGAPLLPEQFSWVAEELGPEIHLASISGGTDIISCFMLGVPTLPVYRGQIQAPGLGMAVECWVDGMPRSGVKGELVCTKPFPSMPLGFWNDLDGSRYKDAYFNDFEGQEVWRHGDYISIEDSGGIIVYGRSDSTLNPGGVRIGTAEIYRVVEGMPEIQDSLAVGREVDGDVEIVLFVIVKAGSTLDDNLRASIQRKIREQLTPRHVPRTICQVDEIPYTRSGKKLEIAVTKILRQEVVPNQSAIANAFCLQEYEAIASSLS